MARNAKTQAPLAADSGAPHPRYATRAQLAQRHAERWGPMSPRTLEVWPLTWRRVNGRAVASVQEFDAEAQRRFDAAPAIRGGKKTADVGDGAQVA